MGAVYRAVREDDFRMQVAIKLLKRGTDTEAALSRFRAERQILAGLEHPNIARLLDGGATETGLPYFVMEYVDGTPLLEYAAPLPVRQRLELFRSVCPAVQYAHQNLIVHRDIKPANILVTPEGIPKLLDFGIAKLLDPAADGATMALTAAGGRLMTPGYASPEQVRGEPVTTATDVYSLGAVLYELLTGRRAHHLETYSPKSHRRGDLQPRAQEPSTVARDLDADLDNIVLMALRKEPDAALCVGGAVLRRHSALSGRPAGTGAKGHGALPGGQVPAPEPGGCSARGVDADRSGHRRVRRAKAGTPRRAAFRAGTQAGQYGLVRPEPGDRKPGGFHQGAGTTGETRRWDIWTAWRRRLAAIRRFSWNWRLPTKKSGMFKAILYSRI